MFPFKLRHLLMPCSGLSLFGLSAPLKLTQNKGNVEENMETTLNFRVEDAPRKIEGSGEAPGRFGNSSPYVRIFILAKDSHEQPSIQNLLCGWKTAVAVPALTALCTRTFEVAGR